MEDKAGLEAWKERVGAAQAEAIKRYAARRGTMVHNLVEQLVRNNPIDYKKQNPVALELFLPLRDYLGDNLNEVWAVEAPVYSHKLRVAGRTDLIGLINGVPSIIDIKTASRVKKEEWIKSYFMQCAAYAFCVAELTKININRYTICMVNEETGGLNIFTGKCSDYVAPFYEIRRKHLWDCSLQPSSH
jgi:hypothetical protein